MASSHIENLRAAVANRSTADIKPTLLRLLAEMKSRAHTGSTGDFFVHAIRAVAGIRGSTLADERTECLRLGVSVLTLSGLHRESIEAAEAALKLASSTNDKRRARLAHTLAGAARAEAGDVPKAVEHYELALRISNGLGDVSAQAVVLNNLGIALNYAGLYRDAVPCLEHAAYRAKDVPESNYVVAKALCNLAQSQLGLGNLEAAHHAIQKAIAMGFATGGLADDYAAVIRFWTLTQVLIAMGDQAGAAEAVRRCGASAGQNPSPRMLVLAETATAFFQSRYGDSASALEDLKGILASTSCWPDRMTVYPILIKAQDEQARPDLALELLREFVSEVRALRRRTIEAILPAQAQSVDIDRVRSEVIDLQQLTNEENRLRAAAAERELHLSQLEALERLAISADLREETTGAHGFRVGRLTSLLCSELGKSRSEAYAAELAARLHDIGKISLPDRIMLRPEALEDAERQFVSAHTRIGAELLSDGRTAELRLAQSIALHHHEWWNGEGYPSKLSGNRIPIHARIVALADVFDALTHGRPYAPAWPADKALAEIRSRRGTQFDPELTDVFLNLMERLISEHEDLDAYLGQASRHSPFLQARNKIRQMLEAERENEKRATVDGNQTRH